MEKIAPYQPKNKVRIVTAASLFDGHDAAINIMRRIMQRSGAEIIHLGHNRSVEEIVNTAIQEDVQAVGLSSLSGAHMRLFPAVVEALGKAGAPEIPVLGGGVIPDEDIVALKKAGIVEIFTPGTPVDKIIEAFQNACELKIAD